MISFGFISLDVILILLAIALLFFLSYKKGKRTIVSLTLALYPALIIFKNLPFVEISDNTSRALIFILIYAILFVLIKKYTHVKKNHSKQRKVVDSVLLTLSYLILLVSVYIYSIPSLANLYSFSPQVIKLVGSIPYGVALLLPMIILFLTNKRDQ